MADGTLGAEGAEGSGAGGTGTVGISAIDGMAGIGKTALAVHAAHQQALEIYHRLGMPAAEQVTARLAEIGVSQITSGL